MKARIQTQTYARQQGFTLIELVVVMILIALLSGIVVYSIRGHIESASVARAVDHLESLDRRLRAEARKTQSPVSLSVHRNGKSVHASSSANLESAGIQRDTKLPKLVELNSLRIGSGSRSNAGGTIEFNRRGQSPSYAFEVKSNSGSSAWLVTLGLSGQHIRCKTEAEVDALLRP